MLSCDTWLYYRLCLVNGFNGLWFLFSHKYSISFRSLLYHSCLVPCWLCPHRHVTRLGLDEGVSWEYVPSWLTPALTDLLLNCCWPLPAQWFLVPSPTGQMTIFYCLTALPWALMKLKTPVSSLFPQSFLFWFLASFFHLFLMSSSTFLYHPLVCPIGPVLASFFTVTWTTTL
jgi:hypothetical protein